MQQKRTLHLRLTAVLAQGLRLANQWQSSRHTNPITARTIDSGQPLRVRTDLHAG